MKAAVALVCWKNDLRSWITAIIVVALLTGCAVPPGSPTDAQKVVAMTYNIRCGSCENTSDVNHWSRRKQLVSEVIRQSGADLVGLQEAELFQVKDLVQLLPYYEWYGVGRDDGQESGEMTAVLIRRSAFEIVAPRTLWLSESPDLPSKGWDATLNRTLTLVKLKSTITGGILYFFNTHFDHRGDQARLESSRLIVRTAQSEEGHTVILTGDLNLRDNHPAYKHLATALRDAASISQTPPAGGNMTFNGFGHDLQSDNKIDFIFVSAGQKVLSHQVITDLHHGQYPSDHFPIVATVVIH
jgi:endonuclease/exonuclease/phosphatase family metal-dependent hydrolase